MNAARPPRRAGAVCGARRVQKRACKVGAKRIAYPGKGADSPVGPFGVLPGLLACFFTPPSEPGVRLSPHPALPLSVFLSLFSMTFFDVQCLKIFRHVCIDWPLIPSYWSDMIHMQV